MTAESPYTVALHITGERLALDSARVPLTVGDHPLVTFETTAAAADGPEALRVVVTAHARPVTEPPDPLPPEDAEWVATVAARYPIGSVWQWQADPSGAPWHAVTVLGYDHEVRDLVIVETGAAPREVFWLDPDKVATDRRWTRLR